MSKSEQQEEQGEISIPVASAPVRRVRQGPVMPIGGAEDKDDVGDSDPSILTRFVELASGKRAHIVVIPTASGSPEESGQRYVEVFGRLGA